MSDYGHEQTDKELQRIEKLIAKEYAQAAKEVEARMKKHFAEFDEKDKMFKKKLDAGDITQQQYNNWRMGQMAIGDRWKAVRDSMAQTLVNADVEAAKIIQGNSIKAYVDNMNYGTYEVETGSKINTGFVLYDAKTVENLLKEDPGIIPMPKPSIPKDEIWNRQKLTSAVTQGILQGESVSKIAERLAGVAAMDENAALRNARTYTTAAENKGRLDSYERAEKLGIKTNKKWIATLDERTRMEHRHLDNMSVPYNEPFKVDVYTIEFPGDPNAEPEMFYNCRCTLVADIVGQNYNDERKDDKLDGMTYEEWKHAKDKQKPEEKKEEKKPEPKGEKTQVEETKAETKEEPKEELHTTTPEAYKKAKEVCEVNNIEYREVKDLDKPLTQEEIIQKLAGGDMTKGSCASLAFAYAGNTCGLDVTDFRDGVSRSTFSRTFNIETLLKVANANTETHMVKKEAKETAEIIKNIPLNKEFMLVAGKHASIIRRTEEKGLEYLELQHATLNGWRPFVYEYKMPWGTEKMGVADTLHDRFGCLKTASKFAGMTLEHRIFLTDVETFEPTVEFKEILGYINTDPDKQKKGAGGSVK